MKKYPRISDVENRDKNTNAACRCGEIAKFKACIQEDYFRGNDTVVWACDAHKKDVEFLTGSQGLNNEKRLLEPKEPASSSVVWRRTRFI